MKKNYHPIKINFTEEEHELATETARKCGLTVVELCRIQLRNRQPKPIPDRAYRETLELLYELHNQIKDDEMAAKLRAVILHFQRRMLLPERSEANGGHEPVGDQGAD